MAQLNAVKIKAPRVPQDLLKQLREDFVFRRIGSGFRCLEIHQPFLLSLDPAQEGAVTLLGYIAQWVSVGFENKEFLEGLLARFDCIEDFSLLEYVHLQMTRGVVAMEKQDFQQAIKYFQFVLSIGDEITDKEPISIANFWKGRCLRRQGRYDDALNYVVRGRQLALQQGYSQLAGVMEVLEGWIAFQAGEPREALRILGEAEAVLSGTDDYVTLGNIHAAYGRIARRQGMYERALEHFSSSIDEYTKRNPYHRNLARAHINTAIAKRQLARQMTDRIDRVAAMKSKSVSRPKPSDLHRKWHALKSLTRLREEALEHLTKARDIFSHCKDQIGLGSVNVSLGSLCLQNGELDEAAVLGASAFALGTEKRNNVLKASSRILQCEVECARLEDEIDEHPGAFGSSRRASELGREALEYAKCTQNRRLIARACIILGLASCLDSSEDVEEALHCADEATLLLTKYTSDQLWKELQHLKSKLRDSGEIDSALREWSQGLINNKTFRQVTEDFAAIVIPSVWRREGCKISRVADRLSISPKKVRRILRNQGIMFNSESSTVEKLKPRESRWQAGPPHRSRKVQLDGQKTPKRNAAAKVAVIDKLPSAMKPTKRKKGRRKLAMAVLSVMIAGVSAHAQNSAEKGPMSIWLRGAYQEYRDYFVRSADKVPESMYGMRPGAQEEVRTFGQILGHVANDNYYYCSAAKGEKNPKAATNLENLAAKADMEKALKDSFTYCDTAYDSLSDTAGLAVVTVAGEDGRPMQTPRIGLLVANYGHVCEHYGNLVTYMRINSVVPPSSEPRKR